jgi:hypothetical protein
MQEKFSALTNWLWREGSVSIQRAGVMWPHLQPDYWGWREGSAFSMWRQCRRTYTLIIEDRERNGQHSAYESNMTTLTDWLLRMDRGMSAFSMWEWHGSIYILIIEGGQRDQSVFNV